MEILNRFKSIMAANINNLLDKAEDPEKMVDQYIRDMEKDLREVKANTAKVMADEQAIVRKITEAQSESTKLEKYAVKALEKGNEADSKAFLTKKVQEDKRIEELETQLKFAKENTLKMRQMHDKLQEDIGSLVQKKEEIKSRMKIVKTKEKMMNMSGADKYNGMDNFKRMEEKSNRLIDELEAKEELNKSDTDDFQDLKNKYDDEVEKNDDVEEQLRLLKERMNKQ